ncbi:MAG: TldD/PmbA family protein [Eubacteriales bacterium]|nr:TldD/PmbA family protein [Eubacteriales bacterium]
MITELQMREVLDTALSTGGDFAELFFEDREETNIKSADGAVQGVKKIRIYGAGLTVLSGTQSVYVYTNHTGYEDLRKLAKRASGMLAAKQEGSCRKTPAFLEKAYPNPNPIRIYPGEVAYQDKISALKRADLAARSAGPSVKALNVDYFDNDQRILVANSEGLLASDRRVNTRMRFQMTIGDAVDSFSDWEDYTKAQGFEAFAQMEGCEAFAGELAKSMENRWKAAPAQSGRFPVVLDAGACGTLWHECCGHGLEACAIASGSSIYRGMLGKRVASDKVTLLDDGTYPGLYGSSAIDDEGHPRQRNVLIENGILKQYLCDRLHGRMIGMESNGCGRRQNYTYAATSRMSNTYLAPGTDDETEIIRSVPEGLFVKSLGGGTGGARFTLIVKEGFWIKNGQIDRQVKGLMLSGNGLDVMQKVDRVGKKLQTDMGGFCGAASGLIPTTTFQPMVRISEMAVSGEGGAS